MTLPRQRTVLLVDDYPSIRLILAAGLKAHGFDVLTAATAEKAVAYCEGFTGTIDILLTDIGLLPPELWPSDQCHDAIAHGVALAKRARHLRPSIKVVLFTGYSDQRLQSLGVGMEQTEGFLLLHKPCGVEVLVKTFRQLLDTTITQA